MTSTLTASRSAGPAPPGPPPKRPFGLARHSLALTRRSLIKIRRTPEGLADAMVLPVVFLAMLAVFAPLAVHAYQRRT